jgi:Arc/MetJ family transcription regulator
MFPQCLPRNRAKAVAKTLIDLDEEAPAFAAEALGTRTKKDIVNAALREVTARARRKRGRGWSR